MNGSRPSGTVSVFSAVDRGALAREGANMTRGGAIDALNQAGAVQTTATILRDALQRLQVQQLYDEFGVREAYKPVEGGRSWAQNRPVWLAEFARRGLDPAVRPEPSWWTKIPTWVKIGVPVGLGLAAFLYYRR